MNAAFRQSQQGAVLIVALIMLVVVTLLAVGSMRSVTLETRLTAHRAHTTQLVNSADAGLREAEFRYYGPGHIESKLKPTPANCTASNRLRTNGVNTPCLLAITSTKLAEFVNRPDKATASFLDSVSTSSLVWMPYVGTDAAATTTASNKFSVGWNSILVGESATAAINAEYGAVLEGQGTYFYLNNAKAGDELYLQSTHANIYLGLNN